MAMGIDKEMGTGTGTTTDSGDGFEVTIADPPARFRARADRPLLFSAERAGVPLDSSCRNGTCRTCIAQLRSGSVHYRIAWPGLSAEEKAAGWILPCVAFPRSDLAL